MNTAGSIQLKDEEDAVPALGCLAERMTNLIAIMQQEGSGPRRRASDGDWWEFRETGAPHPTPNLGRKEIEACYVLQVGCILEVLAEFRSLIIQTIFPPLE